MYRKAITKIQAAIIVVIVVVAAVLGYWYAFMFASVAPERDYFKIGVVTELTGTLSRGGYIAKRGYDTWADYVNDKGGILINGKYYRVELVYADAKSDPSEAAKAVDKLLAEGVDFLLGPYGSATAIGAAPVANERKIPLVIGSAGTHLIKPNLYKYVFQSFNVVDRISELEMKIFVETFPNATTYAIVGSDDAWGKELVIGHTREVLKYGKTVVLNETYPLATTEFGSIAAKIKLLNPDVVMNCGQPTHHYALIKACKDLDFNPKAFYVIWGVDSPDFVKELGSLANGVCGEAWWINTLKFTDPVFGNTTTFNSIFNTRYGRLPDSTEATCCATGVAVQIALEQYKLTPPFDQEKRDKLVEALEEISIETLAGKFDYDTRTTDWHVNTARDILLVQVINGTGYVIAPSHLKQANAIYPKPSF